MSYISEMSATNRVVVLEMGDVGEEKAVESLWTIMYHKTSGQLYGWPFGLP